MLRRRVASRSVPSAQLQLQCEDLIARVCSYRKEVFFLFEMLAFAAATGALHKCVVGWNEYAIIPRQPRERQTRLMLDWQTSWRTMGALANRSQMNDIFVIPPVYE